MSQRRRAVPFDPEYFARRHEAGESLPPVDVFRHIWRTNHWAGQESPSGPGSGEDQTAVLHAALPALFRELRIRSLLDLPCGDGQWMARMPLEGIDYVGADLLPEIVDLARQRHGGPHRRFRVLDLTSSDLPPADLLLCRDCLVHFSYADIRRTIRNLRRQQLTWLLVTTFPGESTNTDIVTGDWRPLNLQCAPFDFPPAAVLLNEGCTEGGGVFRDKSLGLWRIPDLPDP